MTNAHRIAPRKSGIREITYEAWVRQYARGLRKFISKKTAKLVDVRAVADYFGDTVGVVPGLERLGGLPEIREGHFRRQDIENWVEKWDPTKAA